MNKPLVSVIITTYRREHAFLMDAIDSVRKQTYAPIEILLIDDNGKDTEFGKENQSVFSAMNDIRYYGNEKNSGAQVSRNRGIMLSKGEYVAFLDDDDLWHPEKIEKQMKLFEDPEIGLAFCDGYTFLDGHFGDFGMYQQNPLFDRPVTHEMELFNDYIGSTSQAVIRKECLSKSGLFDCDMPARQDYEMWIRLTKNFKALGVGEPLFYYRIHKGERISASREKSFKSYRLVLQKHKADYDRFPYAKAKLILRMFSTSFADRRYMRAGKYFFYALVTSPECVVDVIQKRLRHQSLNEYYQNKK